MSENPSPMTVYDGEVVSVRARSWRLLPRPSAAAPPGDLRRPAAGDARPLAWTGRGSPGFGTRQDPALRLDADTYADRSAHAFVAQGYHRIMLLY